jgi:hypothetical protein
MSAKSQKHLNLRARLFNYMRSPEHLGREKPDITVMGIQEMAEKMSATQESVRGVLTSMSKETGSYVHQISPSIFEFRPPPKTELRDEGVGLRAIRYMQSTEPGSLHPLQHIADQIGGMTTSISGVLSHAVKFDPELFITRPIKGVYSYRPPMYPHMGAEREPAVAKGPLALVVPPPARDPGEFVRSVPRAVVADADAPDVLRVKLLAELPDGRVLVQNEAGKPYWLTPVE